LVLLRFSREKTPRYNTAPRPRQELLCGMAYPRIFLFEVLFKWRKQQAGKSIKAILKETKTSRKRQRSGM